jgi:LysM repeat protein
MKRLNTLVCVIAQLILLAANAAAVDFTSLRPGARANALGTAFSSVADDPYTIFYNPAGLMNLNALEDRFGLARRVSTLAPVGEASIAYIRPVPDTKRIAGLGYHAVRQTKTGSMDSLYMGLGDSFILKYFQRPVLYGVSFKLISLRGVKASHLGLGLEGGILFSSDMGLNTALTLSDLDLGLGRPLTTLTIGNSYRWLGTLIAMDLKVRGSYTEVFYGLERGFFNSLLQLRAGKGVALNGPDYLIAGMGFNVTPWIIDFAASIPWKGFNQNAGLYEVNAGYRFGAPTFTERFIGDASVRAAALKTQIDELRTQKAGLESSIAAYRVNKSVMETDLVLMQSRMRDIQPRLKNLELQILEAEHRKENPRPKKAAVTIPKPEKWPKSHKVAPGETLRSIASQYYGNPSLWERIYEANQDHISRGLPVENAVLEIPFPPAENRQ